MILGTGIDICSIVRIQGAINRHGDRFINRIFTTAEQQHATAKPAKTMARYAQMFAVKESCAKALGTGIAHGVSWHDMVLQTHPTGQPYVILSGGALARLQALTPDGYTAEIHVAITDDVHNAHAMIMVSAIQGG